MSKKYIVTGGAGFIGSHITDALIARGDDVIVIDDLSNGFSQNVNPKAEFHQIDICNASELNTLFDKNIEGVFHCAAIVSVQYSLEHPEDTAKINIQGTKNILESAAKNNLKRLVFCSSAAVYGETSDAPVLESAPTKPISPYGKQKLAGESECLTYVKESKLETVILRYFNVYGPRQRDDSSYAGVISIFVKNNSLGKPLTIFGDGSQMRDFIHVMDIAAANLKAMDTEGVSGEIINIGSGKATSVKEVAESIGGEIVYAAPRVEVKNSLADISKAKHILNWSPAVILKEGVAELVAETKTS